MDKETRSGNLFQRTELLLGADVMRRLASRRVILFGVGGVGSWCAESLIRSGLRRLTIVDADCVCESNVNRQLMATTLTVGQPKVEALRRRLMAISPEAEVTALQQIFTSETAPGFRLDDYDYVIDAIDSLRDKAALILMACQTGARLFSSMGAARRLDPARIRVAEFWKVTGDPLARALRNRFKRTKTFPRRRFACVFSDELLPNRGASGQESGEPDLFGRTQANGTVAHVTAIFGFTLAGLLVQDVARESESENVEVNENAIL